MARITIERCIHQIPNRFDLVLTASKRSRQLKDGGAPMVQAEEDSFNVIALREIEQRKIDASLLEQPPVNVEEQDDDGKYRHIADSPASTPNTRISDESDESNESEHLKAAEDSGESEDGADSQDATDEVADDQSADNEKPSD